MQGRGSLQLAPSSSLPNFMPEEGGDGLQTSSPRSPSILMDGDGKERPLHKPHQSEGMQEAGLNGDGNVSLVGCVELISQQLQEWAGLVGQASAHIAAMAQALEQRGSMSRGRTFTQRQDGAGVGVDEAIGSNNYGAPLSRMPSSRRLATFVLSAKLLANKLRAKRSNDGPADHCHHTREASLPNKPNNQDAERHRGWGARRRALALQAGSISQQAGHQSDGAGQHSGGKARKATRAFALMRIASHGMRHISRKGLQLTLEQPYVGGSGSGIGFPQRASMPASTDGSWAVSSSAYIWAGPSPPSQASVHRVRDELRKAIAMGLRLNEILGAAPRSASTGGGIGSLARASSEVRPVITSSGEAGGQMHVRGLPSLPSRAHVA